MQHPRYHRIYRVGTRYFIIIVSPCPLRSIRHDDPSLLLKSVPLRFSVCSLVTSAIIGLLQNDVDKNALSSNVLPTNVRTLFDIHIFYHKLFIAGISQHADIHGDSFNKAPKRIWWRRGCCLLSTDPDKKISFENKQAQNLIDLFRCRYISRRQIGAILPTRVVTCSARVLDLLESFWTSSLGPTKNKKKLIIINACARMY